jgi:branched-chain amino acid transport system permease protein
MKRRLQIWLTCAILLAAGLAPLVLDPRGYWIRVLALSLLFAAMAQAWNIVGGLANQISLGHAAFLGIGAYTSTILLQRYGLSPWLGMAAGGALGAVAAAVISVPAMRLQGHYFALATLGFGEVMRVIANVWKPLTGGPEGLSVPFMPESFAMLSFKTTLPFVYIALAALTLVTVLFEAIRSSAMGYRLRAIRENQDAAEVIGIDTARVKLTAAVISGAVMAMLGTLYAQIALFFDPDTVFGIVSISVPVALMAIVGGIGTAIGPILGAFFIVPLEEAANDLLSARGAGLSQLAYGLILIAVILWQPRGFAAAIDAAADVLHARAKRRGAK